MMFLTTQIMRFYFTGVLLIQSYSRDLLLDINFSIILSWMIDWLSFQIIYLTSYILVQKSVSKSSESRVGLASKWQVWSILFPSEIYDHMSKGKFGPLSNCSKRQVWSRFGEKIWTKLAFWKHPSHVIQFIQKRQVWE